MPMKPASAARRVVSVTLIMITVLTIPILFRPIAADTRNRDAPRTSLYIEWTDNFYRAMQEQSDKQSNTLTTRSSEEYLRQIAIAARYTVETNLQVLRQQERIIKLLEEIRDKQ